MINFLLPDFSGASPTVSKCFGRKITLQTFGRRAEKLSSYLNSTRNSFRLSRKIVANFQAFEDQILEFERTSRKDRLMHCGLSYPSKRHKSFLRELFSKKK